MPRTRSIRLKNREKTCGQKCADFLRSFILFMFSNIGVVVLVIAYTIGGAGLFIKLEQGPSNETRYKLVENGISIKNDVIEKLWFTTCCKINTFSEEEWKIAVNDLIFLYQENLTNLIGQGYNGETMIDNDPWSFAGAFLYALTVITSIGYGNTVPTTTAGKYVTIVYAIIGMPLFLLYLSNIGSILGKSFKWIYVKCCLCNDWKRKKKVLKQRRIRHSISDIEQPSTSRSINQRRCHSLDLADLVTDDAFNEENNRDLQNVTVPITLCMALIIGYICAGAVLFSKWENLDLLDSAYFCFISLSTIGFGDIVPGQILDKSKLNTSSVEEVQFKDFGLQLSFVYCAMYLIVGMALSAMCFNLMQEEVVHKVENAIDNVLKTFKCRH